MLKPTAKKILSQIQKTGPGYIFAPNDFSSLGTRVAVDTALCRLVKHGHIRRLARGLYHYPIKHPLLGYLLPPLDKAAKVIAQNNGASLQVSGAAALHALGLTTQVPAQLLYLTDGASKDIKIGNSVLRLRHASTKVMVGAGKNAGMVMQAIRHLGKNRITFQMIKAIKDKLSNDDKQDLKDIARYSPAWAKTTINELVAD